MDLSLDATDIKLSSLKHRLDHIPVTIKQLDWFKLYFPEARLKVW